MNAFIDFMRRYHAASPADRAIALDRLKAANAEQATLHKDLRKFRAYRAMRRNGAKQ